MLEVITRDRILSTIITLQLCTTASSILTLLASSQVILAFVGVKGEAESRPPFWIHVYLFQGSFGVLLLVITRFALYQWHRLHGQAFMIFPDVISLACNLFFWVYTTALAFIRVLEENDFWISSSNRNLRVSTAFSVVR